MSIHEGHRQRLKNRFRAEGLDHFEEHQVLELLLYYVIPRKDTNPIAHALLERFGSLSQVLEAQPEELADLYDAARYSEREPDAGTTERLRKEAKV